MLVQAGMNLELIRAAIGHEDYDTLKRYVRLAAQVDLGPLDAWAKYIQLPERGGAWTR